MGRARTGKTLIELLVVMAIIAIFLAIVAPTYFKALGWSRKRVDRAVGTRRDIERQ